MGGGSEYGVGFIDASTGIDISVRLPSGWTMWDGENSGATNGMKGKQDYAGNYWFIAVDGSLHYWLFRAKKIVASPYIQLDKVSLQSLGDPAPNQLTIDQDGAVYFPSSILISGTTRVFKGIVTSEAPFTMTFTYCALESDAGQLYCVTLSKDHSMVACIAQGLLDNQDSSIYFVQTSDMTLLHTTRLPDLLDIPPLNMETDVSGSINDDCGVVIASVNTALKLVCFDFSDYSFVANAIMESLNERTVAVDTVGTVRTAERVTNCPDFPNPIRAYDPTLVKKILVYSSVKNMTCPEVMPTHFDIVREAGYLHDIYCGTGIGVLGTTGEVRKLTNAGVNSTAHTRNQHIVIGTGTPREAYT